MRVLIIGWSRLGPRLLTELDRHAADGSSVIILYDETIVSLDAIRLPARTNLDLTCRPGSDPSQPLQEAEFSAIILLAYRDDLPAAEADGRTLIDLAIVRSEMVASSLLDSQVIVQLLDADRVRLADLAGLNCFVVSEAIGSHLIAQFAASPQRQAVFGALYDPDRSSLQLVSLDQLGIQDATSFEEVVRSAEASNLLAIGWLTSIERGRRVVLSPALTSNVDTSYRIIVIG